MSGLLEISHTHVIKKSLDINVIRGIIRSDSRELRDNNNNNSTSTTTTTISTTSSSKKGARRDLFIPLTCYTVVIN